MNKTRLINLAFASMMLFAFTSLFVGCATDDNVENVSERPWNDTQGWQGGLPSGLNEGR